MFHPLSLFHRDRNLPAAREDLAADPFYRLQSDMNRLFDEAFSTFGAPAFFRPSSHMSGFDALRSPRIDISESDAAIEIEAELPGVEENDLNVEINDATLTIRAEKRAERKDEKSGDRRVTERAYGAFARSISLPFAVDPDAVEAVFKNGVLRLTLPKPPEAAARSRKIAIKRG